MATINTTGPAGPSFTEGLLTGQAFMQNMREASLRKKALEHKILMEKGDVKRQEAVAKHNTDTLNQTIKKHEWDVEQDKQQQARNEMLDRIAAEKENTARKTELGSVLDKIWRTEYENMAEDSTMKPEFYAMYLQSDRIAKEVGGWTNEQIVSSQMSMDTLYKPVQKATDLAERKFKFDEVKYVDEQAELSRKNKVTGEQTILDREAAVKGQLERYIDNKEQNITFQWESIPEGGMESPELFNLRKSLHTDMADLKGLTGNERTEYMKLFSAKPLIKPRDSIMAQAPNLFSNAIKSGNAELTQFLGNMMGFDLDFSKITKEPNQAQLSEAAKYRSDGTLDDVGYRNVVKNILAGKDDIYKDAKFNTKPSTMTSSSYVNIKEGNKGFDYTKTYKTQTEAQAMQGQLSTDSNISPKYVIPSENNKDWYLASFYEANKLFTDGEITKEALESVMNQASKDIEFSTGGNNSSKKDTDGIFN